MKIDPNKVNLVALLRTVEGHKLMNNRNGPDAYGKRTIPPITDIVTTRVRDTIDLDRNETWIAGLELRIEKLERAPMPPIESDLYDIAERILKLNYGEMVSWDDELHEITKDKEPPINFAKTLHQWALGAVKKDSANVR